MGSESIEGMVNELVTRARHAAAVFSQYDQEHTDRIVRAVCQAGFNQRVRLAKMACEETGLGIWEHKVLKNVIATQLVYEDIKNQRTVGIIREDEQTGIIEIAQPLGPILAIIPMTNPTSTVLFKILISLKARNPIIISPHRRALKCSIEAARICYEAALAEDAPEDCIQWISESSREQTAALMSHKDLALILATGGGSLVKAAYSSGTPAIGVGAGNVPVCIEKSADIPFTVQQILDSKTFDNSTVCASEQAVIVERAVAEELMAEFKRQGAHFLSAEEIQQVERVAYDRKKKLMNAEVVGQSVQTIARMAGIEVPEGTRVLIAEQDGVGEDYPLSSEILAPILALYVADDFSDAVNRCLDLNYYGGVGHTVSIFSNDDQKIKTFAKLMNAGRVVVNTPSSQGAVGGTYNTLHPSLTLGCGAGGKNITTDNISVSHLLNVQRIAHQRVNNKWAHVDKARYLDETLTFAKAEEEYQKNYR